MKNKGFTLVEVIGVVGLLTIIALLSVPSVTNYLKNSKKIEIEEFKKNIYTSTEIYIERNKELFVSLNNPGGIDYVDINLLVEKGYLLEGLKNPETSEKLDETDVVKVIVKDSYIKEYNLEKKKKEVITVIKTFNFKGSEEEFTTLENGNYKIEAWGASGGTLSDGRSGHGAYSSGIIYLKKNQKLYIQVGSTGSGNTSILGYNGGGKEAGVDSGFGGGGGATDIRLTSGTWDDFQSLSSRIMVAAGGGGATTYQTGHEGAPGGALNGFAGARITAETHEPTNPSHYYENPTGGTQTSGGKIYVGGKPGVNNNYVKAQFGIGGTYYGERTYGTGGGGGYYGGGMGGWNNSVVGSGASGSSFISGYTGANAIDISSTVDNIVHTNQPNHYSGHIFKSSVMINGKSEMPTHDGLGKMTGNKGNGYVKISLIKYE